MSKASTTYVGMDVHKQRIAVCVLAAGSDEAVEWQVKNEPRAVDRMARRLIVQSGEGALYCVYEAGPCGYDLQRRLRSRGIAVDVVAPSLIPRRPGERVKTDRRDARKLAHAARAGMLTVVAPPTEAEEAARDLCRCRDAARRDRTRARHRLGKMLLRRGIVYREGKNWTLRHHRWLRTLRFEDLPTRTVFEDYLGAIELLDERLRGLDERLAELAQLEPYREPVERLVCFRGLDTVSAMTLVTELHDFRRFPDPRSLMGFLGLVPSENSSGGKVRRSGITKTGNSRVRRVLIEAAWHYRHRPAIGKALQRRRVGKPIEAIALADRAQRRLHRRYHRLVLGCCKPAPVAITAVARELTGFVWAALHPAAT